MLALLVAVAIHPAWAATLVGSQTATASSGTFSSGTNPFITWWTYTATASGTATTVSIDMHGGTAGKHVFCGIYNAAGTSQLGVATASASIASAGIVTETLVSGVSITNGTQYTIACQFDTGYPDVWTDGNAATYVTEDDTAQTFGTLPASLTNSGGNNKGLFAMWASSAGSTCTHSGRANDGSTSVPNGSSGSYWGKSGNWVTPDCSSVYYWSPAAGNFVVN